MHAGNRHQKTKMYIVISPVVLINAESNDNIPCHVNIYA